MDSKSHIKSHLETLDQQFHQMDYSSYYAPTQPFQFLGLPPTSSHIIPTNPEDYQNNSPPHNGYEFQNFDAYNHFNAQGIPEPPTPQSQPRTSIPPGSNDGIDTIMDTSGEQQRQASNSGDDEENMTPAQSRRKAQNRAAQRAFRERKEKHVKELEAQVAALKASTSNIATENERLRLSLQKVATENEILKATTSHATTHQHTSSAPALPDTSGPTSFTPQNFYGQVLEGHADKVPSHRIIVDAQSGSKLLGAAATWEFILSSSEFKQGMVDVSRVSEALKGKAKCDGQGPVFEEMEIRRAIAASVAAGNDEMI